MLLENTTFGAIFGSLKDHRINRTKKHSMESIVFITLAAVISGCDTWNDIEDFGHDRKDWILKHMELPGGIPSHDTLNRFFSSMNPETFERCFREWVVSLGVETAGDVVAIDGKSIKGSRRHSQQAIHMVSAWSTKSGITLGQLRTPTKKSELDAIPVLLDSLFLEGSIVTIDALGTVPRIAQNIVDSKAKYILQVKMNRWQTVADINKAFESTEADSIHESLDNKEHGRTEKRIISVIHNPSLIRKWEQWPELKSIVLVKSEFIEKATKKKTESTAYYITSLDTSAEHIASCIRSHWGIENKLHWMLDVAFSEDKGRKVNENAVINFSLINKIALEMLKKETSTKIGVKSRRIKAGRNTNYLDKVMGL